MFLRVIFILTASALSAHAGETVNLGSGPVADVAIPAGSLGGEGGDDIAFLSQGPTFMPALPVDEFTGGGDELPGGNPNTNVVPLPSGVALGFIGLGALAARRRR